MDILFDKWSNSTTICCLGLLCYVPSFTCDTAARQLSDILSHSLLPVSQPAMVFCSFMNPYIRHVTWKSILLYVGLILLFPNEGLCTSYHASDTVCKSCVTLKIYWIGCSSSSLTLVIVVIPSTNLAIIHNQL